ncbi:MAG: hypothetical protein ACRBCK_01830 [Alphaproteobacteria bacterium]
MLDEIQIRYLSGAISFLSMSLGSSPYDYSGAAFYCQLDKGNILGSYLDFKGENDIQDRFVNFRKEKQCLKWLEKWTHSTFGQHVNNGHHICWKIIEEIHLVFNYKLPEEFFICDLIITEFNQSGNVVFIPQDDEFLVLVFYKNNQYEL